jgi:hypothetical protein
MISAVLLFFYYRKKREDPKMLGGITNSVSFRQGTNVEFEGPSFVGGADGVPEKGQDSEFTLGAVGEANNRDFSNPMYDMQGGGEPPAVLTPAVSHQTPPPPVRHRELNPVSIDTGKDTQRLVMAEDDSEC